LSLTLQVTRTDDLDQGEYARLVVGREGAMIGRSPGSDLWLPDERNFISGEHCEVAYRDGGYVLIDRSKNGSYLAGDATRLPAAHWLSDGEVITIGPYRVAVFIEEEGQAEGPFQADENAQAHPAPAPTPAFAASVAPDAQDGAPQALEEWAPIPPAPAPAGWGPPPEPSAWSEAPAPPPPAFEPAPGGADPARTGDDVWERFAELNQVDWARGGFVEAAQPSPVPPPSTAGPPKPAKDVWDALLEGAGLSPGSIRQDPRQAAARAGALLRRLTAGLVVMLEARRRAKEQMGAEGSVFVRAHNPLKFGGLPEEALAQMLNPPEAGFLDFEEAVADSFHDLQAHQVATLAAMQGALRSTLERFSPGAMRARAPRPSLLARLFPGAREIALWRAYEREFDGVVADSDEAFLDMFAHAFRRAYDRAAANLKARR
jgi:type VI secretion system FHA domain protein